MRHSHAHGDGLGRDRNGTLGNLGIETCSIPTACPVEHGPAKTLFVKGKSFPSLYDTIRDDPGALHKVDREGAALVDSTITITSKGNAVLSYRLRSI